MANDHDTVADDVKDGIAWLRFNRPDKRNAMSPTLNFNVLGEVDTGCVFLCDSPMFHVIGIVTQIWPPRLRGGTFIVSSGFDAENTNDRLGNPDFGVTHYFCVPQMADALRHAPNFAPEKWARLKALFTGGAPNPPANIRWWLDRGVRMVDGYGMTETGTTLGMPLAPEILREKAGAVGLCGPLTSVRLVDEDDRDVPDGTPGEILIFGLNVTPGYWNRPEERARAFTGDGWIRTGDVGRRDADGFISIVDRRKDMFISGRECVSGRDRNRAARASGRARGRGHRHSRRTLGRGRARLCHSGARRQSRAGGAGAALSGADRPLQDTEGGSDRRGAAAHRLWQGDEACVAAAISGAVSRAGESAEQRVRASRSGAALRA